MDPALAIYHTQLYKSYWEEQQRITNNNLPASSALYFPVSNTSVTWPYVTPLLGVPPPPLPHLSSDIHPLGSSIVNTDAYSEYVSSNNTSSTGRLLTLSNSTSPNVQFFNPYWNLFGASTAASSVTNIENFTSIQPSFDQPTKALKIKSERESSPVLTCTNSQSIIPSSQFENKKFLKEEFTRGTSAASISNQRHPVRPKCEPCYPHGFIKSPSSSSYSSGSSLSPIKRSTALSEEESTPLAPPFSCESGLETTEQSHCTPFHSVEHLIQQVSFPYFAEARSSAVEFDREDNCRFAGSRNCAPAEQRSTACQTCLLAEEEPLVEMITSTARPQNNEKDEENGRAQEHRDDALDPPLLTRELVEPDAICEQTKCELRTEAMCPSVICEHCLDPQLKSSATSPSSKDISASLRLISHHSSDPHVHADWRLVHDPCTGLFYRIPSMMMQPVLSAASSVNTVESATQTRQPKRVLCDTCLKKCRLRNKNVPILTPQAVRKTVPLVDLCGSLFVLSKLSDNKTDVSHTTQATAALCNGFLTDLSNYDEHCNAQVFDLDVLERLIRFLESVQENEALLDDNSAINLRVPFDTSQTREVHTDRQHFTHLIRFSHADRLLLEQIAQVKRRLIEMRRSNAKFYGPLACRSKEEGGAGAGEAVGHLCKKNVTSCATRVKKCSSSNFSPFGSELHELAFIASEQTGKFDVSSKNKCRAVSSNSNCSMNQSSEFTEPLRIDTSLEWQCSTVANDPDITSASPTPYDTECTSVATSVSFNSPLQNSLLTLDTDLKHRYFNSMTIAEIVPEVANSIPVPDLVLEVANSMPVADLVPEVANSMPIADLVPEGANSMPIADLVPEVTGHRRRRRSSGSVNSTNKKDESEKNFSLIAEVQKRPPTKRYCEPPPALEREAPVLDPRPPSPEMRSCMLDREDLYEGQRILITVDGNWFAATLHLDSRRSGTDNRFFSVALDGGRQLTLSCDQVLNCAVAEMKPQNKRHVPLGSRVAAYWSDQLSNLYAGTVSQPPSEQSDLRSDQVFVCFDDEDQRIVDISKVRMLPEDTPVMPVNARSDIFLSLPRRPRLTNRSGCLSHRRLQISQSASASHKNVAKSPAMPQERRRRTSNSETPLLTESVIIPASASKGTAMRCFRWADRGLHKGRKIKHKTLFCNDQVISVGDVAQFISNEDERPYLGRVEDLFEENNHMWVRASWYYQPNEMADAGRPYLHIPAAIFASTHYDTNEVQTILTRVSVLQPLEFKRLYIDPGGQSSPQGVFFEAGVYDAVLGRVQTTLDIDQFDHRKGAMESK